MTQLQPGCVVRLQMNFPEGRRTKFLVLVAEEDPEYWSFIVNSNINSFIQARPHLMQCQVTIHAAAHPFLQYDSNLACHDIKKLRREEVIRALMQDTSGLLGVVAAEAREQIISAVKFAQTLSPKEKQLILKALG